MKLSIVTTMYRSAPYLREFHDRVTRVAAEITPDFEVIYVNDGSPDDSQVIAAQLVDEDARVRVVELSRNFGHHKAMMTGLAHAQGELVWLIDCDLEEEPEWLPEFHRVLTERDADVVYGVQRRRKGGLMERVTGRLFYRAFSLLSDTPVEPNIVTARLMRREYVESLVQHQDREVFLAGLWAITGFRQVGQTVVKRDKGSSSYDFRRRFAILVNAITSFSTAPLRAIFYLGCLVLSISSVAALVLLINRLTGQVQSGWTSLMVSIWLLGGMCLFAIGVLGIYLAKIHAEVKRRPYTVIRGIYGQRVGKSTQGGEAHVEQHLRAG